MAAPAVCSSASGFSSSSSSSSSRIVNPSIALGIDLGTTFTKAAILLPSAKTPKMLTFLDGATSFASHVALQTNYFSLPPEQRTSATFKVGDEAISVPHFQTAKWSHLYDSKRFIGCKMFDNKLDYFRQLDLPFSIVADPKDLTSQYRWTVNNEDGDYQNVSPEFVSKLLLDNVVNRFLATVRLPALKANERVQAVITVPANFTDSQKTATRRAAELAQIDVLRLIPEPSAAAIGALRAELLSTASDDEKLEDGSYMVFDFGGGTLDVSVMDLNLKQMSFNVLNTEGDTLLGGRDIDEALIQRIKTELSKEINLSAEVGSIGFTQQKQHERSVRLAKLRYIVAKAKQDACNNDDGMSFEISPSSIDDTANDNAPGVQVSLEMLGDILRNDRRIVEKKNVPIAMAERMLALIQSAKDNFETIRQKSSTIGPLRGVILAGGSCLIPIVGDILQEKFGGSIPIISRGGDIRNLVAYGATILARMFQEQKIVQAAGVDPSIPTPSAGGLNIRMREVIPRALGQTFWNSERKCIYVKWFFDGQTSFPCSRSMSGFTVFNQQTSVMVRIMEASESKPTPDSDLPADHRELSKFLIDGLPPRAAGLSGIVTTFAIDENGILVVSAVDSDNPENKKSVTVQDFTVVTDSRQSASASSIVYTASQLTQLHQTTRCVYSARYWLNNQSAGFTPAEFAAYQQKIRTLTGLVETFEPTYQVQEMKEWQNQAEKIITEAKKAEDKGKKVNVATKLNAQFAKKA